MKKHLMFITLILAGLLISCSDDGGGGGLSCPANYTNAQHDSQLLNFAHQQNSTFNNNQFGSNQFGNNQFNNNQFNNGQAVVNNYCVRNDIVQQARQQGIGNGTGIVPSGQQGGSGDLHNYCNQYANDVVQQLVSGNPYANSNDQYYQSMYQTYYNFCIDSCSLGGCL